MGQMMSEHDRVHPPEGDAGRLEIFDPPMCCPTGMCGPTIDKGLLDVNEMVLALKEMGVGVQRYQMGAQPQAFMRNPQVYRLLQERQMAALPITVVNGRVVKIGAYPTLAEVQDALKEKGS
jgi:hypothetical protein